MIALYFDTETSGIKTPRDPQFVPKLVQLGALMQDLDSGRVLAELNLIANQYPLEIIPEGAIRIHGITNEMAADYGVDPKLIDVIFAELMKKADVIVAHNLDYDLDVVQDNLPLTRDVLPVGNLRRFCTMDSNVYLVRAPLTDRQKVYFSSKGRKPDAPFKVPSLMETYLYYFERDFLGAHDAMADIRACAQIFQEMLTRGLIKADGGCITPTDAWHDQLKAAKEAAAK